MKTALLLFVFNLPFLAQAQLVTQKQIATVYPKPFARKTWLIGVQGGYSPGEVVEKSVEVTGYGGYFMMDKLLVGLAGNWIKEGSPNFFYAYTYTAGPILRYQLTRTRVSPFVAASYQIGSQNVSIIDNSGSQGSKVIVLSDNPTLLSRSFTAGLSIGIVPALRVDIALNWHDVVTPSHPALIYKYGFYQPQFGVNYTQGRR